MILFAYIIPLYLIYLGFHYRDKKAITIFFLIYFWIIMGFNVYTPDYEVYESLYNNALLNVVFDGVDPEWGYKGLNIVFNLLGYSYQEFRVIFAALYAMIAISAVRRLCQYPNFVLAFLLIWPFLPSVSGQRQTMASIIVCWGIPYLVEIEKKGIYKYVICVLIASTIHTSMLFYLIFIYARNQIQRRHIIIILCGVLLLTSFLAFSSSIGAFTSLFSNPKIDMWLNKKDNDYDWHLNIFGFLIFSSFVIVMVFVMFKQANLLISVYKKRNDNWRGINQLRRITIYRNIGLLILFTIPGFTVTGEFQRFLSGMLPVFYSVFAYFRYCESGFPHNKKIKHIVSGFVAVFWMAFGYITGVKGHDVFATLTDNVFFK